MENGSLIVFLVVTSVVSSVQSSGTWCLFTLYLYIFSDRHTTSRIIFNSLLSFHTFALLALSKDERNPNQTAA
jgi:hypothetical protein